MSVYNIIACAMVGIVTGLFNGLLAGAGYIAPVIDGLGNTVAAAQPEAVNRVITFSFVGLETFTGIALAVLLAFFSVEKTVARKQAIIKARQGAEPTEELPALSARDEALWQKELKAGDEYFAKICEELKEAE